MLSESELGLSWIVENDVVAAAGHKGAVPQMVGLEEGYLKFQLKRQVATCNLNDLRTLPYWCRYTR